MDTDTVIKEPPPLEAEYESLRAELLEALVEDNQAWQHARLETVEELAS